MKNVRKYPCIPSSKLFSLLSTFLGFVAIGIILFLVKAPIARWNTTPQSEKIAVIVVFSSASAIEFCFAIWGVGRSLRSVHLYPEHIVCTAPFCRDIVIEYNNCHVGMDYSYISGGKMWWIYLCNEEYPKYKQGNKRINSLKYKDGFIRIAYYDEVYDALIEVLPKKKASVLESFHRNTCRAD